MPVRSRGSLLAGTATLAGLLLASLGCHSSRSDHDAYSISPATAQPADGSLPPGGAAVPSAGYAAQPVAYQRAAYAPVTLQPVPGAPLAAGRREVIASTFQPVVRVSAMQTVSGPELQGGAPPIASSAPVMPARLPSGAPRPAGNSGTVGGNGPLIENNAAAPGNIVLPQPRLLAAAPNVVVSNGAVPPMHPPYPNVPREFEKMALPPYVVEPPDILLIQASDRVTLRLQRIQNQYLVTPDGFINLGVYGRIRVVGMTLEQVADAVAARLLEIMPGLLRGLPDIEEGKEIKGTDSEKVWEKEFRREGVNALELIKRELQVDVLAYNSKYYYVITDGGGYGQQVYPFLVTGNETVLDALAKVNGLPAVANKHKVWVARATRAGQPPKILPVDWVGVAKCGQSATNYQIFPGDRVYVDSSPLIKADTFLSKLYSPFLRSFGVTLLGASTVNTIKNGSSSAGGLGLIR
ncbi:MAG TPA: polysaccharide biosynthesis/export family protein [Gemmataceae bacterium]|nr:polysaccharide biosynthesis/export family protein [Gemmataceae bacterium]